MEVIDVIILILKL